MKIRTRKNVCVALIIIVIVIIVGIAYDNNRIVVTDYSISSNKVDKTYSIVQVSDIHNCQRLGRKLISNVRKENPQYIVITGDLVDSKKTDMQYALDVAEELSTIAPTFFVTGNHEIAVENKGLKKSLSEIGVTVLSNNNYQIDYNITFFGIDDPMINGDPDADSVGNIEYNLSKIQLSEQRFNILLSHRPEAFVAYADKGFDLVLTGHAHGGQFRIPMIGGVVAPDQGLFPKYDSGMFNDDNTVMIVNRGIGNSIIPIRINNPPEIVSITISPEG